MAMPSRTPAPTQQAAPDPSFSFLPRPIGQVAAWKDLRTAGVSPAVLALASAILEEDVRIARFDDATRPSQFLVETGRQTDQFYIVDMAGCVCSCNGATCPDGRGSDPFLCPHLVAVGLRCPEYRMGVSLVMHTRAMIATASRSCQDPLLGLTYQAHDKDGHRSMMDRTAFLSPLRIRTLFTDTKGAYLAPEILASGGTEATDKGSPPFLVKHYHRVLMGAQHALAILTLQGVSNHADHGLGALGRPGSSQRMAWWRDQVLRVHGATDTGTAIKVRVDEAPPEAREALVPIEPGASLPRPHPAVQRDTPGGQQATLMRALCRGLDRLDRVASRVVVR